MGIHFLSRSKSDLAKTQDLTLRVASHPNAFHILQPTRAELSISAELVNLRGLARRCPFFPRALLLFPLANSHSPRVRNIFFLHRVYSCSQHSRAEKDFATLNEYVLSRVSCFLWICLYWHFSGIFTLTEVSSLQKGLLGSRLAPSPTYSQPQGASSCPSSVPMPHLA